MKIQKGYKQTEIGIIPQDWEVIPIGEIFNFKNGLNKEKQYFGQGTPIVNYMDVFKFRGLLAKNISGKVTVSKQELGNYEVLKGDVFFTRTSETVEEIGISTVILEDLKDTVFSGFILRARPKNNKLDDSFKQFCFSSNLVRKGITSTSSYTTRALTNGRLISNVKIPLPPSVSEQKAIAQALSDTDALITALDALIEKKRLIKQGTMQQLLTGKRRLQGFSEEWIIKAIGKEIELMTGFPFQSNKYTSTGIKLLRGANIKRGNTDWSYDITEYWGEFTFELQKYQCQEGDIVISMDGSLVGRSYAQLKKNDLPVLLVQRVARLRSNKIDLGFLKHYIGSDFFVQYCDSVKTTTAIPHISPDDIKNFKISLPPSVSEQKAIAKILNDMDNEITILETKRHKYHQLKQGMMQELLTGKTRLQHE